jgi:hypothetical protein
VALRPRLVGSPRQNLTVPSAEALRLVRRLSFDARLYRILKFLEVA